jgi:hypothetical protein
MKKKEGKVGIFIAMMSLQIVVIIIAYSLKLNQLEFTRTLVEDSLVNANLAAATIDLEEYGATNNIINNDTDKSFNDYSVSLKEGLGLDNSFMPDENSFIKSKVVVERFIIYSVLGNDILMASRDTNGNFTNTVYKDQVGIMKTPDGFLIKDTTVYSQISFSVHGLMNQVFNVDEENSVAITNK